MIWLFVESMITPAARLSASESEVGNPSLNPACTDLSGGMSARTHRFFAKYSTLLQLVGLLYHVQGTEGGGWFAGRRSRFFTSAGESLITSCVLSGRSLCVEWRGDWVIRLTI